MPAPTSSPMEPLDDDESDEETFADTLRDKFWEGLANVTGIYELSSGKPKQGDEYNEARIARRARLDTHAGELQAITGEPGDVVPFPEFGSIESPHLTFKDVSFSVNVGKEDETLILAPVSGHFTPGSLVALMGPSGCGKSTLLDMLADKKTAAYEGDIFFNGHPRDALFPRVTAYVPQADIMPAHLTVKEVIQFADNLKRGNFHPKDAKKEFQGDEIDMILEDLGLFRVRKTRVGNEQIRGISGGQKRRVTLAKSYVSGAKIIFADEPTSGLSSTDAETCVRTMRWLAKRMGNIFIVVIHQPRIEVANLFDHLILLTANPGRAVYNGPMKDGAQYYASLGHPVPNHSNPADHFLDMITPGATGAQVDKFVAAYDANMKPKVDADVDYWMSVEGDEPLEILEKQAELRARMGNIPQVRNSPYALGFFGQLYYVFQRKLRLYLRNTAGVFVEFFTAIVKGVILGVGFMNIADQQAQLQLGFVYLLVQIVSLSSLPGMASDIEDRNMMKFDSADAYYCECPYIISLCIIKTFFGLLANSLFIVIMFLFGGFQWISFPRIYMWGIMSWLTFDSMFAMLAAIAKTPQTAQATAMPLVFLFGVYNGFTITQEGCPAFMKWAIYISPAAYTIEGVAMTLTKHASAAQSAQWATVNELYGFTDQTVLGFTVMIVWIVLFRAIQAVGLVKCNKIDK